LRLYVFANEINHQIGDVDKQFHLTCSNANISFHKKKDLTRIFEPQMERTRERVMDVDKANLTIATIWREGTRTQRI
jgi:hypothetical protein